MFGPVINVCNRSTLAPDAEARLLHSRSKRSQRSTRPINACGVSSLVQTRRSLRRVRICGSTCAISHWRTSAPSRRPKPAATASSRTQTASTAIRRFVTFFASTSPKLATVFRKGSLEQDSGLPMASISLATTRRVRGFWDSHLAVSKSRLQARLHLIT